MELYFKCQKCGYVFYDDNKKFVEDKEIQEKLKKSYILKWGYCESCLNYEKWERNEYFT